MSLKKITLVVLFLKEKQFLVETMWEQFCNLGIYESNVIDTTTYSIQETVSAVQEKIASRAALLS